MSTGAITGYIDVAQVVLYMFWVFFAGLVYYLHRENKREGYPLESDGRRGRVVIQGFPDVPPPKTFRMRDGTTFQAPGPNSAFQPRPANATTTTNGYPGNPIVPTGNPMLAGVGPGAWAERADVPDTTLEDGLRIVPLRVATDHDVASADIDPRGLPIYGDDNIRGGTVVDLWVDRSEAIFRYLEVEVPIAGGSRRVLVPMTLVKVRDRFVDVASILGKHFADVPATKQPEQITRREEDIICAYYAAGTLYATPARQEPLV
jgi:photosynthetic reaction center H subunit